MSPISAVLLTARLVSTVLRMSSGQVRRHVRTRGGCRRGDHVVGCRGGGSAPDRRFTLKQNPLRRHHLDDFVSCYAPGSPRSEWVETERFKSFTYDELIVRDMVNLDITWLRDESLEDMDNLPAPEVISREIVEDLTGCCCFVGSAETLDRRCSTLDRLGE